MANILMPIYPMFNQYTIKELCYQGFVFANLMWISSNQNIYVTAIPINLCDKFRWLPFHSWENIA